MTPSNTAAGDEGLMLIHLDVELMLSWRAVTTKAETRVGTIHRELEQFHPQQEFYGFEPAPALFSQEKSGSLSQ